MTRIFTMVGLSALYKALTWSKNATESVFVEAHQANLRINSKKPIKGDWGLMDDLIERYLIDNSHEGRSCAEIQSINALRKEVPWNKEELFILHLICTDTKESIHCGQVILKHLKSFSWVSPTSEVKVIEGLQVNSEKKLLGIGIQGLLNYLMLNIDKKEKILGDFIKPQSVLNITAGFKAVLPVLTIFGQLFELPLIYIFEKQNELIKTPVLPLSFSFAFMEAFQGFFSHHSSDSNKAKANRKIDIASFERDAKLFFQNNMASRGMYRQIDETIYQQTYLGRMVQEHVRRYLPDTYSSYGSGVELQFLEYFLNEPIALNDIKCDWVERKVPFGKIEFDLAFYSDRSKENCLGFAEIKAYSRLLENKWKDQISRQLHKIASAQVGKNYLLIIYGFQLTVLDEAVIKNLNFIKTLASSLAIKSTFYMVKMKQSSNESHLSKGFFLRAYEKKITRSPDKYSQNNGYQNPHFLIEEISLK